MAEPLVPLGEIVTTHGLHGWLKLNLFNSNTTALAGGVEVILEKAGARSTRRLEATRPQGRRCLIKLNDVDSVEQALEFVGSTLLVGENDLEILAPGEYYHYQVIGFEVFAATGERVGTISSTLSTPAGELYVVQGAEKEYLIPAVKEFIDKVDFSTGKMIISPPEGLLDL
ncbi:MAG TPA: ribosome maturation factor RimM [Candidatus Binatia bacterium]|nr:ribosome maturation factor RimM [Candidatus Binatia bacterium]